MNIETWCARPLRREGFSLIELLIVVVVIGILAAIAIPRFQQARNKAFQATLVSDLKHVVTAQELYWARNETYSTDILSLGITVSPEVSVTFADVSNTSWGASATHTAMPGDLCAVFSGGSDATPIDPAEVADRISCTF